MKQLQEWWLVGALMLAACTDSTAPPAAAKLSFTVQPSGTMAGDALSPRVEVAIQDASGNTVSTATDVVTIAIGSNPGISTLTGRASVNAVGGVASFPDLQLDKAGTGYTLTATASRLQGATSASFDIREPNTAPLHLSTTTTGNGLDPDGYSVCVDQGAYGSCSYGGPRAITSNGVLDVTVDTGAHTVLLSGVASNCWVAGENPRSVLAIGGSITQAAFAISCGESTLHITTTTTGSALDADGYWVCIDYSVDYDGDPYCSDGGAIGAHSAVAVVTGPGAHVVKLFGVADNCTVTGDNPRTVIATGTTVTDTTEVPFAVTCADTGSVHITTTTTGTDLSPDGYTLCVGRDGSACYYIARANAIDDAVTIAGVIAGSHTVTIRGLAENCTVGGTTARSITVVPRGTVEVRFDVTCTLAERIAFSAGGIITVAHADGSAAYRVTSGRVPAWSPDGTRLAYECGQEICTIHPDGTGQVRLTVDGASNHHPTWAPDGLKIAFAATHGTPELYVMDANGSGVIRLTQDVGFVGSPAWSPDGTKIAFDCRPVAGNDDICIVNADGSGFARLTSDPARDYGPAWKPDGSSLAFATTRYGQDEIALLALNGSVTRIGVGLVGSEPTWSPNGTQLAFVQTIFQTIIAVANLDGSNVHTIAAGGSPAWKPHP